MSEPIEFVVQGNAVPKQRARIGRRGHTPEPTRSWEEIVGWTARFAMADREPLTGRLILSLRFYLAGRPCDVDNLAKAVSDACKGVLWLDDEQIDILHVARRYGVDDPRVIVRVLEIGNGKEQSADSLHRDP